MSSTTTKLPDRTVDTAPIASSTTSSSSTGKAIADDAASGSKTDSAKPDKLPERDHSGGWKPSLGGRAKSYSEEEYKRSVQLKKGMGVEGHEDEAGSRRRLEAGGFTEKR